MVGFESIRSENVDADDDDCQTSAHETHAMTNKRFSRSPIIIGKFPPGSSGFGDF